MDREQNNIFLFVVDPNWYSKYWLAAPDEADARLGTRVLNRLSRLGVMGFTMAIATGRAALKYLGIVL